MRPRTCAGCGTAIEQPATGCRKWCSARCRKQTLYGGTCVDCGARTNGYNGPGTASDRCRPCSSRHNARWDRSAIIAAIQQWAAEHVEPPTVSDWTPVVPGFPSLKTVQDAFGSWASAIEEAGFPRPLVGVHGEYLSPEEIERTVALYESGLTLAQVGEQLGIGAKAVYSRLERRGIPRRSQGPARIAA